MKGLNVSDQFTFDMDLESTSSETAYADEENRDEYLKLLAKKLSDPEFRNTPGFPDATNEAILRLSDPPYYTACPNPFLSDLVPTEDSPIVRRQPFASDIKEGRHETVYLTHTYHAKTPWRAILPYVMAYTRPGELVYDGFSGTGMVGVACNMAAEPPDDIDLIDDFQVGARRAVVSDLSPMAAFIASNLCRQISPTVFRNEARSVLAEVESELGFLYKPKHAKEVHYYVWSDVFRCPKCDSEFTFFDVAYSPEQKKFRNQFACPSCDKELTKTSLERVYESQLDRLTGEPHQAVKARLVRCSYEDATGKRKLVPADDADHSLIQQLAKSTVPLSIPVSKLPYMHMTHERNNLSSLGVTHFHHFFTERNLVIIGRLLERIFARRQPVRSYLLFWLTSCVPKMSKLMSYNADGIGRVTKGIYYIGSVRQEFSPFKMLERAAKDVEKCLECLRKAPSGNVRVSTNDVRSVPLEDESVDYIFTDPPFGENVYYSDLNYLWETLLGIRTASEFEATVNRSKKQTRTLHDYADAMRAAFREYHRILKPGRWMTVEFHNKSNSVWRVIQEGIGTAGFVVADVRVLDKKLKTFKQIASQSTMKQDLVISAYKPTAELVEKFSLDSADESKAWAFVSEHLRNVPVFVGRAGADAEPVVERTPQMLHDRMVAFFVQRLMSIPISAPDFFSGLAERFARRDGMYFLPDQVAEYDRKRLTVKQLRELELFVSDEASAIQWIRQLLESKPQSFQDLQPKFMTQVQTWPKHEKDVDLKELLEQSFLRYDGKGEVPSQIANYLSKNYRDFRGVSRESSTLKEKAKDRWYVPDPRKTGDLEKLRFKTLIKEFEEYKNSKDRKIKLFRTEAVRAGFKDCYEKKDYDTIIKIWKKLPSKIVQEDEALLMYYDVASMRAGN